MANNYNKLILSQSLFNSIMRNHVEVSKVINENDIHFEIHADVHSTKSYPNDNIVTVIPFFNGENPVMVDVYFSSLYDYDKEAFKKLHPFSSIKIIAAPIFNDESHKFECFAFREYVEEPVDHTIYPVQHCGFCDMFYFVHTEECKHECCGETDYLEFTHEPLKIER